MNLLQLVIYTFYIQCIAYMFMYVRIARGR